MRNYNPNVTIDKLTIRRYYGIYKGAYVCKLNPGLVAPDAIEHIYIEVVDMLFSTPYQFPYVVYYDGNIYKLDEVYYNGYLSVENLKTIAKIRAMEI